MKRPKKTFKDVFNEKIKDSVRLKLPWLVPQNDQKTLNAEQDRI